NLRLSVPAGQTIDATLVFTGEPCGDEAVLLLYERSRCDNVYTNSPRCEARLPLEGACCGTICVQSGLLGVGANAVSAVGQQPALYYWSCAMSVLITCLVKALSKLVFGH